MSASYARDFQVRAALRDGTPVCVRAIRADDKPHFKSGFGRLSSQTIYHRFFHAKSRLTSEDLRYFTELDFTDHVGLVLTIEEGSSERLIAVGRFIRLIASRDQAEIAFVVADDYQGRGAATLLLKHLANLARGLGIREFVANVQLHNGSMLKVFEHSGFALAKTSKDDLQQVVLDLASG